MRTVVLIWLILIVFLFQETQRELRDIVKLLSPFIEFFDIGADGLTDASGIHARTAVDALLETLFAIKFLVEVGRFHDTVGI